MWDACGNHGPLLTFTFQDQIDEVMRPTGTDGAKRQKYWCLLMCTSERDIPVQAFGQVLHLDRESKLVSDIVQD